LSSLKNAESLQVELSFSSMCVLKLTECLQFQNLLTLNTGRGFLSAKPVIFEARIF
jgi:hypothetical protein